MFESIYGNEENKKYLEEVLRGNQFSNSYIFLGKEGVGKQLFAEDIAKKILAKYFLEDYIKIEPDGKSIKISQIREMINKVYEKPISDIKKIIVINDAEKMTIESQNALLKTLEEPPKYMLVFLITSDYEKLLNTIKSRCVTVKFKDIESKYLEKKINISETKLAIELLNGSFKDINEIEKKVENYKKGEDLADIILKRDIIQMFNSELLYNSKDDIMQLLDFLNNIMYKKGIYGLLNIVEKTKKKILESNNYEMTIDNLFLEIEQILK